MFTNQQKEAINKAFIAASKTFWEELEIVNEAFPVWKTITLGVPFEKELKKYKMSGYAQEMINKISIADKEIEIDLVCITMKNLGFSNSARIADIFEKAQELGLEFCPPEVGPQLRLQYKDQPRDEWLLMGMEPIAVSGGDLNVFSVGRHEDRLWLYGNDGGPNSHFFLGVDCKWVFIRPRK